MTTLTFLRHATAQPHDLGISDAERQLIRKGERQALRVAAFCMQQALLPTQLLCSPLVRARQTASLLQQHLPNCPEPQVVEWLHMDTPVAAAMQALQAYLEQTHTADCWLVGHEPLFSALISQLLGSPQPILKVKKASLVRVEYAWAAGQGTLLWSIPNALMK